MITELIVRLSRTGAGEAVMWFTVLLSVISVAVMIERLIFFTTHKDDVRSLAAELNKLLLGNDYVAAQKLLETCKGFETRVLRAALEVAPLGKHAVQELAASATKMERLRFERGLAFLGTVGNNAPFVGLFGTVLEIISALYELGTQSGGNVGAGAVMATLSQALAATAIGLLVALPAVAVFNYFNRRIKTLQTGAEALVHVLLAHMGPTEGKKVG
ncbi:MAG: MotA/TolQ/ExbB proton channel family protein [Deltaproteobacteria bacterium]|nr:MotA/TolQ/ExbB proton channel family protein [Deltaproteobacteria bacterium]